MRTKSAERLVGLFPHWFRSRYGEGMRVYLKGESGRPKTVATVLKWALLARFADAESKFDAGAPPSRSLILGWRWSSIAAFTSVFGGALTTYLLVDDSRLAAALKTPGLLSADWKLFLCSLGVSALALAARAFASIKAGGGAARRRIGQVASASLSLASLTGIVIAGVSHASFFVGPFEVAPAAGKAIALSLFAVGGMFAIFAGRRSSAADR